MTRLTYLTWTAALLLPGLAYAVCPPAAGYVTSTQPTMYLADLGITCPDPTDPRCAQNGVVVPSANVDRKDQLFVWLPGQHGTPADYIHIASMVGYAGYRALFLSWADETSVGEACAGTSGLVGGLCVDSDCAGVVRSELTTGRDDLSSDAYTPVTQLDGIVHRLAMALNIQYEEDLADLSNDEQWDSYCSPDPVSGTAIDWSNIVLGGHSFGGNQAAYISYRKPTSGVIVIDSGYDTCEAAPPDLLDPAADVYDPSSDYNTTACDTVNWYDDYTDQSAGNRVFFLHEEDVFPGVVWPTLPPSFDYFTPSALDASSEPLPAYHYSVDDTGVGDWAGEPIVSTAQDPAVGCSAQLEPHASMASNTCMPDAPMNGYPVSLGGDVSALHLFATYVEVLCSF